MKLLRNFSLLLISILIIAACSVPKNSVVVGDCGKGTPYLAIHDIQGTQHRSPYDGQEVFCVQGVVTALDGGGFYLQEMNPDDDPRTSEAIYIDLQAFARAKVGDHVVIETGTIREYNPAGVGENSLTLTTLRTSKVEVVKSELSLPEPVILGNGGLNIPDRIIENDVKGYVGRGNASLTLKKTGMDFSKARIHACSDQQCDRDLIGQWLQRSCRSCR